MGTALLLMAHGSRRPEANADLEHLAEALRQRGGYQPIVCSYLELAEPNIQAGADLCVAQGANRVLMLPYFLSPGVHVTEDLEKARRQLQLKYPRVGFLLCEPIGRHQLMVEIIAQWAREAEEA